MAMGNGGAESPAFFFDAAHPCAAAAALTPATLDERTIVDHAWAPLAAAEAAHAMRAVGVAHASFSKIRVHGAGAQALLSRLTTNVLPKETGQCRLTYALTPTGRVLAEFTVCRRGKDDFYVVGSRDAAAHDIKWLRRHAADAADADAANADPADPDDGTASAVQVDDLCDAVEILHIAGPRSAELLDALRAQAVAAAAVAVAVAADDSEEPSSNDQPPIGFMRCARAVPLGGGRVRADVFRISFSGERGFELHAAAADAAALLRAVLAAGAPLGLRPFGGYALNMLRIEKGFKLKADFDYSHYSECDVGMFCAKKKDFVGKMRQRSPLDEEGSADAAADDDDGRDGRVPVMMRLATGDYSHRHAWSVPGDSPICRRADGAVVGVVTSAAPGASSAGTLAHGFLYGKLSAANAAAGTAVAEDELYVSAYGKDWDAALLSAPPLPCVTD
jgi:dimethylglycine dehydrogenase